MLSQEFHPGKNCIHLNTRISTYFINLHILQLYLITYPHLSYLSELGPITFHMLLCIGMAYNFGE